jgi:hypothetical protein
MKVGRAGILVALTLSAGCVVDHAVGRVDSIELAVPARASAHVTLAADGDRIAAAWAATGANGTDIYAAVSKDGARTFGTPVRVNEIDGDASANGEQPPRVLMQGADLEILWVSKRAGVSGIRAAASTDGGLTFAPARSITPAGLTGARGWESATLGADGVVHAVWLDGRAAPSPSSDTRASAAQAPAAAVPGPHHHHGAMRQDIYHAMWKGADPPVETLVASNVCFCCKTAVVSRGTNVFVAWRHLFPGGVRDIAMARSTDGGRTFQDPVRVSEDNWKIDACPDDGPAMTIDRRGALHVTWPTLVNDPDGQRMAIFESSSQDGGATFSPRARVDAATGGPAHPRIATGIAGPGAVVWDELALGARRVLFRPVGGGPPTVLSAGGIPSYPAIVPLDDGFVVAWTDQAANASVIRARRLAR